MKKVSIGQSLSFSFSSFFGNILFFVKGFFVTLFIAVVGIAISILPLLPFALRIISNDYSVEVTLRTVPNGYSFQVPLVIFVFFILLLKLVYDYIILGWSRVAVDFYNKGTSTISRLFSKISVVFKYFFASLVFLAIILFISLVSFGFCWLVHSIVKLIGAIPSADHPFDIMFTIFLLSLLIGSAIYFAIRFVMYPYFIAYQNSGIFESLSKGYRISTGHVIRLAFVLLVLAIPNCLLIIFFYRTLGFYALPFILFFFLLIKIWEIFAIGYFYGKLTSQEV